MRTLHKIHTDNELLSLISEEEGDEVYEILNELSDPDLKTLRGHVDQLLDCIDEIHEDRTRLQGRSVKS